MADGLSITTDGEPPRRHRLALVAGLIAIVLWQSVFFRHGDPAMTLTSPYHLTASGGIVGWQPEFVYFLYYLNLYPVTSISTEPLEYSVEGARRLIAEHGRTLVMDRYWTVRYGDLAKTYLYLPHVWLKGRPVKPRMLHANALAFTLALLVLFAGFWAVDHTLLGLLLTLLIGSNPFQVHEVYANNNVFGWPITIAVLMLGLHLPFMRDRPPRIAVALLIAVVSGLLLGTLRQIRTEPVLVAASVAGVYLTVSRMRWWLRLALVVLLGGAFSLASIGWADYFEAKYREARRVVAAAGGHTYDGPRHSYHFIWHAVWCGLGDFDAKYGYQWSDLSAIRYAWPILQRRGFEARGYPPVEPDPLDSLTLGVYWDKGGQYARTPFETREYTDVAREKVLADVVRDPLWYASILGRRIVRVLTESTPPSLAFGNGQSFSLVSTPSQAIWGLLTIVLTVRLLFARDWFHLKLLAFTLPLTATAVLVYSGGGTVYYSILHLVAVAVIAAVSWERLVERRGLARASIGELAAAITSAGGRAHRRLGWRRAGVAGLAVLLLAAVAYAGARHIAPRSPGPLRARPPLTAILRFDNQTSTDSLAWVGDGLGDLIAREIAESGIRVLDPEGVGWLDGDLVWWGPYGVLTGRKATVVNIVADRSGADRVVAGRTSLDGPRLMACVEVLAPGPIASTGPEACVPVDTRRLSDIANHLAQTVLPSLEANLVAGPSAEPGNVQALRFCTEAQLAMRRQMWGTAIGLVDRSLREDPGFASARVFRARLLSRWRRLEPSVLRDLTGAGSRAAAIDVLRARVARDPQSIEARMDLGRMLLDLELFGEAATTLNPLLQTPGAPPEAFGLLASARAARGDMAGGYQAVLEIQRRAWQEPRGVSILADYLARWAFFERVPRLLDDAASERLVRGMPQQTLEDLADRWSVRASLGEWPQARPLAAEMATLDDPRAAGASALYAARGHLFQGRSRVGGALAEEAVHHFLEHQMDALEAIGTAAEVRLEQGDAAGALELARQALTGSPWTDRRVAFWEALALARLGRWAEAERVRGLLAEEASATPGPSVQRVLLHLDGELSLLRGDARRAVATLSEAARLLPERGFCGEHVPIWNALGRAYVAAGEAKPAEEWLERVADASYERLCWPVPYARSMVLLGRLQVTNGLQDDAAATYRRFLDLWEGADLAVPEQSEARRFLQTLAKREALDGTQANHDPSEERPD
jgi:tetratricopeptide (TPR) repeat protein